MNVIKTNTFIKQLKRLRLPSREEKTILDDFDSMTSNRASSYRYFQKGSFKAFKKYKKGAFRIKFSYCKECFNKYREVHRCQFCSGQDLERLVIFTIFRRKSGSYDE